VKSRALLLATALLLAAAAPAFASAHDHERDADLSLDHVTCCDDPARWAPRHDERRADFAIHTRQGDTALLIDGDNVVMQLSDRAMHKVTRSLRDDQDGDDNALGRAIKAAVYSSVRSMLANGIECPIRELRDVRYTNGELVLIARNGTHVFEKVDIGHERATQDFAADDAKAFVREFHRAQAQHR
jgi:hypothetical protein